MPLNRTERQHVIAWLRQIGAYPLTCVICAYRGADWDIDLAPVRLSVEFLFQLRCPQCRQMTRISDEPPLV